MLVRQIEKLNIIISALAILGAYLIWNDAKISLSVAIGSVIGGANFWVLYRIFSKILMEGVRRKILLGALAALKFAVLIFILWAVIKWVPINAVAFLVGLSTVVVAISGVSLRGAVATKQSPELK